MDDMKKITQTWNVTQLSRETLLRELEEVLLPRMASTEYGWRFYVHLAGQQELARTSARLILLARKQQDQIDQLEQKIAELEKARVIELQK